MKNKIVTLLIFLSLSLLSLGRDYIDPIVKVHWHQEYPYNILIPNDYPVGCVPLAVAQTMTVFQYPDTYDWNLIEQGDTMEIAKLIYDCGTATKVRYGKASSAKKEDYFESFVSYFDYPKTMTCASKAYHTEETWEDIIYSSLENGSPVLFVAYTDDEGHAFICDGYSDGLYHINWGWGGTNDGFYDLENIKLPNGKVYKYEMIGVNLSLSDIEANPIMYNSIKLKPKKNEYRRGQGIYFDSSIYSMTPWVFRSTIGFELTYLDGTVEYIESFTTNFTLLWYQMLYISDSYLLPNGRYYIKPVFFYDGKWNSIVEYQNTEPLFVYATSDKIMFTDPPTDIISFNEDDINDDDSDYIGIDGRRYKTPLHKGFYIKNGKKVFFEP